MKMKTRYKYIHFVNALDADKNPSFMCYNNKNDSVLGWVEYYKPWKQYVFEGKGGCVFNISCLNDIANFMKQMKVDQAKGGKDAKDKNT